MELVLIAGLFFGGIWALIYGLKRVFSGAGKAPSEPVPPVSKSVNRGSQRPNHAAEDSKWSDLDIERRHPGSDWVFLPKFDKDNECKLICIADLGHREAVKPLVDRVIGKREYSLALKREPTNAHDPNAIQVVDKTNGSESIVGYLPKHLSATIADRYQGDMPISVMVQRAIWAPDGEVFPRLGPLVPKKALRKKYERT